VRRTAQRRRRHTKSIARPAAPGRKPTLTSCDFRACWSWCKRGRHLSRDDNCGGSGAQRPNIILKRKLGSACKGLRQMGRPSTWTSRDDDQLRSLAASGESSAAIAARLNRSAAAIRKRAINLGIGLAGSTKPTGPTRINPDQPTRNKPRWMSSGR
jgi:hypothetical protein